MAVIFSKEVSQDNLLSAYNNHSVEFSSNNVLQAVSCMVDYGDGTFDRSPNPDGSFKINIAEVASVLINLNKFKDTIVPDINGSGYVYPDTTLYKSISITYKISFINGTTEQIGRNYHFIKSVLQPINYLDNVIDVSTNSLALLLPFKDRSNLSYYTPYYEGVPFDFSIFSNLARTVTIRNKKNLSEMDMDLSLGVNRIFLSQGDTDSTLLDDLILHTGLNHIEISVSPTDYITLFIERFESSCGPFLKYFNSTGSYSYFRFSPIYQQSKRTKTLDKLRSDFSSIDETFSIIDITGKDSAIIMKLLAEQLDSDMLKHVDSLMDSLKVELFVQEPNTKLKASSWFTVLVSDGTFKTKNTKKTRNEFKVNIGFETYTLGL